MEKFSCKTTIYAGAGAVSVLADLNCKRLFLVTDPFFAKNGTAQRIAGLAKAEAAEIFDTLRLDRPYVEIRIYTEEQYFFPIGMRCFSENLLLF